MRDEWDYRASRPGDLPDMSLRYDPEKLKTESEKYVEALMQFIGNEIDGADVVEVGCGTGRITEQLLSKARNVTCVEFCERMIQRSSNRLRDRFDLSRYVITFGQDYYPHPRHEVAVCSLVLVHNVNENDYRQLVRGLCRMAKTVYVFEDVSTGRKTSPRTVIRSTEKIVKTFSDFGFSLIDLRNPVYKLFEDEIAFLKFTENKES